MAKRGSGIAAHLTINHLHAMKKSMALTSDVSLRASRNHDSPERVSMATLVDVVSTTNRPSVP
jgi:hypothetical protein